MIDRERIADLGQLEDLAREIRPRTDPDELLTGADDVHDFCQVWRKGNHPLRRPAIRPCRLLPGTCAEKDA